MFSFGSLYDSTAAARGGEHWGHIQCHCGHRHDETLEEASRHRLIHLNGTCTWSCCGANWDDFLCTAAASKVSSSTKSGSSISVSSMDLFSDANKEEKKEEENSFRRFLPTFFTQELICLSCFKPYRSPMKLPCGHSFCRECIEKTSAYQKAAGSFSSRFRVNAPTQQSLDADGKDFGDLRLRQMSRTQRHALLDGDGEKDKSKMEDAEEVNKEVVMCPVCSEVCYVRTAVEDTDLIEKMRELAEQRSNGVHLKCSFCASAVLAGAQVGEASEATLVCSTCGPICARHHALLHVAGPPTFRCHEVNETPMELLPMKVIPHAYEICPRHGCEMDLFDKSREKPLCEMCAKGLRKSDVASRIIREEDKMAFFMEREAKKAKEESARLQERKSREDREAEKKRQEIEEIEKLHKSLTDEMSKCRESVDKSRSLFESGVLTRDVKGLAEMREEVRKVFADGHKALEEMQKAVEDDIAKVIDDADKMLKTRYEASLTLLEGAADASSRAVSVSLESQDVRLMVMKRLKQLQGQLGSIDSLPKEPLEASALLTIEKPDDISKLHLVRVKGNDKGLFAAIVPPESKGKEAPEEPEVAPDEDDDVLLDRIRAKLKDDLSKDRSRRSRENDRYSTLRSAVNSGMSDAMKSEAIGSVLFERAMDILGVDFEAVFVISTTFFEKNSLDHILSDLSSPADFNLELRAIHQFLKEKKLL